MQNDGCSSLSVDLRSSGSDETHAERPSTSFLRKACPHGDGGGNPRAWCRLRRVGCSTKRASGFTLIEVAIVVGIVGLILGALLAPLSARYELARLRQARGELSEAREALYGFALTYGRLPCPDSDGDGREDAGDGGCVAEEGNLPGTDLGVSRADPWGNDYRYRVDARFADAVDGTGCGTASVGVSFALCSEGVLIVQDRAAGTPETVVRGVPALLLSRGFNEGDPRAADSPDEMENRSDCGGGPAPPPCDPNLYVSHEPTRAEGKEFDDVVVWLSPHVLKNRMVQAMKLP